MTMDNTSLYHPLNESKREIQLLTLLPCQDNIGQVTCGLETASLTDNPEYAAICYVWGDPNITTEIYINSVVFPATNNLVDGLLHYRQYGLGLPEEEDDRSLPRL